MALLALTGIVRLSEGDAPGPLGAARHAAAPAVGATKSSRPTPGTTRLHPGSSPGPVRPLFAGGRFFVAYYGTAGTGALGVLGETSPEQMQRRLARAAAAFAVPRRPVRPVYELIVSIADGSPGPDGDYSHDLARSTVQPYLAAARRHHALVVLDLQPGRTDFAAVAKRWAWALHRPEVGLALDPEWRMHGGEMPGRRIGWVDAAEVNATSRWLTELQRAHDLPQKLFVLHQFRTDMVHGIDRVERHPRLLAMVQHVDGFGTPGEKRATYHAVARPSRFLMGFKLFYDEDVPRMSAADVHRLRPRVRFVSFQ